MTPCHRLRRFCVPCLFVVSLLGSAPVETDAAIRLWEKGQDAMREGRLDDAIRWYQQSLHLDPNLARNFLSLAAARVAQAEETEATGWLARYVAAEPEHRIIRLHYAEL